MKLLFTIPAILFASTVCFSQTTVKKPVNTNTEKALIWKPTKIESSYWNPNSSAFVLVDTAYLVYSPSTGRILEDRRSLNGVNLTKKVYTDVSIYENQSSVNLTWNSVTSTFDTTNSIVYTYDNFGNLESEIHHGSSSSSIAGGSVLYTNTLNSSNKPLSVIQSNFNVMTQQFEYYSKIEYTYHPNGFTASMVNQTYDAVNTVWVNIDKEEYSQDVSGIYNAIIYYSWDAGNGIWNPTYKAEASLTPYLEINDPFIQGWENSVTYEYDVATSTWKPAYRNIENETINGGNESFYDLYQNGSWNYYLKGILQKDVYGNETSFVNYQWNALTNNWDAGLWRYYSYQLDGSNLPVEKIDSLKNSPGAPWGISKRRYADYVQVNVDFAGTDELSMNEIEIYPNPINDQFTINSENFTKVQIVDLSGKVLLESTEKIVNSTFLQSGMYLLNIYKEDQLIATKSIMKN
ncbi:MAG: hypothetical protein RLZ33_2845 [Bacteroidota bacterium]|jgi:hypothetical protein